MPLAKCVYSLDGKLCRYEFAGDGHALGVTHRPCVSVDFGFDPDVCEACAENVKFLRTVGQVDRLSQQFTSLKKSLEAVKRSVKRKGKSPSGATRL